VSNVHKDGRTTIEVEDVDQGRPKYVRKNNINQGQNKESLLEEPPMSQEEYLSGHIANA
jgi:hypothetical protein